MKTILTNCFFVLLSLSCPALSTAQSNNSPFTALSPSSPSIVSFNCHKENTRVLLNWTVSRNEHAYQFEIEKSTDGVHFTMAALVFGTDKADLEEYRFFEKAQPSKTYYRVRIVYRNQDASYSDIVACK
jgi:hypothetical protein